MNKWKIKILVLKAKIRMSQMYYNYKLKSFLGIKSFGFQKGYGLILTKFLEKYKLPIYSMNIARIEEDLNNTNLNEIHKSGIRLNKDDYLSIIINTELKQSYIICGDNLKNYLPRLKQIEISKVIQSKMKEGEILKALEIGIIRINQVISNQLNKK